jgi:hypothetical protein
MRAPTELRLQHNLQGRPISELAVWPQVLEIDGDGLILDRKRLPRKLLNTQTKTRNASS